MKYRRHSPFSEQKDAILSLVNNFSLLSEKVRNNMSRYLKEFLRWSKARTRYRLPLSIMPEQVNIYTMDLKEQFEKRQQKARTCRRNHQMKCCYNFTPCTNRGSIGDVNTDPPSNPFDFVGKAKYEAWASLKANQQDAMKEYISLIDKLKKLTALSGYFIVQFIEAAPDWFVTETHGGVGGNLICFICRKRFCHFIHCFQKCCFITGLTRRLLVSSTNSECRQPLWQLPVFRNTKLLLSHRRIFNIAEQ